MLTLLLIGITTIVSLLAFSSPEVFSKLKFNAVDAKEPKNYYRFLTYGLIHGDLVHLMVNMLVLYSFGRIVESVFNVYFPMRGSFYFVLLYTGGLILSIIPSFGKNKNNVFYNAVGASGAVSSVLFSSIILYPTGRIMLLFIPIPIPAPVFGVLYIAYEYYMSRRGGDNIGHDAHLWGALYGLVFTILLKPAFGIMFFDTILGGLH